MYTRHYDLTPDGMRQAFAECVGPYDNLTEDDIYQLAYMVGTALIRRNRSLGVASDEAGGSMLASCSVYAPGGRIKSAAISVKFPNVVGVPTAICFSEDGRVRFGSGMVRRRDGLHDARLHGVRRMGAGAARGHGQARPRSA